MKNNNIKIILNLMFFLQYIFPQRFLIDEDEDTFKLELKEAFRMYDKVPPFSHKANKQSSYKLSVQHLRNSPKADSDSKSEDFARLQNLKAKS